MQISLCLLLALGAIVFVSQVTSARPGQVKSAKEWIERKSKFYEETKFELSADNKRLMGGRYSQVSHGHLPFWFDYELFKAIYEKKYSNIDEDAKRHLLYIKSCVRALKERVLFRILAGTHDTLITRDADSTLEEKVPQTKEDIGPSNDDEFATAVYFDTTSSAEKAVEANLAKGDRQAGLNFALQLVKAELDKVESRNQLNTYLMAFDELDGSAFDSALPY